MYREGRSLARNGQDKLYIVLISILTFFFLSGNVGSSVVLSAGTESGESWAVGRTPGIVNPGRCEVISDLCQLDEVVVVGGSVPLGKYCHTTTKGGPVTKEDKSCSWPRRLDMYLRKQLRAECGSSFPGLRVTNAAIGGHDAGGLIPSVLDRVSRQERPGSQLYIISSSTNDEELDVYHRTSSKDISPLLATFEALCRTILGGKQRLTVFADFSRMHNESFAEMAQLEVAKLYGIPMLSARAAFWKLRFKYGNISNIPDDNPHPKEEWHDEFGKLVASWLIEESQRPCDTVWRPEPLPPSHFYDTRCNAQKVVASMEAPQLEAGSPSRTGTWTELEVTGFNYTAWQKGSDPQSKLGWECQPSVNGTRSPRCRLDAAVQVPGSTKVVRTTLLYMRTHLPGWGQASIFVQCWGKQDRSSHAFASVSSRWADSSSQTVIANLDIACRPSKDTSVFRVHLDVPAGNRFRFSEIQISSCGGVAS